MYTVVLYIHAVCILPALLEFGHPGVARRGRRVDGAVPLSDGEAASAGLGGSAESDGFWYLEKKGRTRMGSRFLGPTTDSRPGQTQRSLRHRYMKPWP